MRPIFDATSRNDTYWDFTIMVFPPSLSPHTGEVQELKFRTFPDITDENGFQGMNAGKNKNAMKTNLMLRGTSRSVIPAGAACVSRYPSIDIPFLFPFASIISWSSKGSFDRFSK